MNTGIFLTFIDQNLNNDEAAIQLVDSNNQWEDILPSERARIGAFLSILSMVFKSHPSFCTAINHAILQ